MAFPVEDQEDVNMLDFLTLTLAGKKKPRTNAGLSAKINRTLF